MGSKKKAKMSKKTKTHRVPGYRQTWYSPERDEIFIINTASRVLGSDFGLVQRITENEERFFVGIPEYFVAIYRFSGSVQLDSVPVLFNLSTPYLNELGFIKNE